jgi:hypothetical protein
VTAPSSVLPPRKPKRDWKLAALIALVIAEAVVIGALLALRPVTSWRQLFTAVPATSPIVIDYSQPGAQVLVDGKPVGFTPFTIIPGSGKKVSVQPPAGQPTPGSASAPASPAGSAAAAAASATAVDVTSDPPGARVVIDGKPAGSTPLVVPVIPGSHEVVVSNGGSSATRTLKVTAGTTASFVATLSTTPGAGWMTIASPVELQVLENGTVVGTTSAAKVMLPAGRHDLVVSNTALGFEAPLRVEIPPGKSISVTMPVPNGSVSLNALPWANVSIDGKEFGTTPVANVELPIGNHEVVWRHPQLGERRQTVTVTVKTPLRLVMDFRK